MSRTDWQRLRELFAITVYQPPVRPQPTPKGPGRSFVIDDRGTRRRLWSASLLAHIMHGEHTIESETLALIQTQCKKYLEQRWRDEEAKEIQAEIESDGMTVHGIAFYFVVVWISGFVSFALAFLVWPRLICGWPIIVLVVVALHLWKTRFPRVPNRVRVAIFLTHGICPSCGYGIKGVPPEADLRVICPECSAAWMIPDGPIA